MSLDGRDRVAMCQLEGMWWMTCCGQEQHLVAQEIGSWSPGGRRWMDERRGKIFLKSMFVRPRLLVTLLRVD